jgi:hypothetical protein
MSESLPKREPTHANESSCLSAPKEVNEPHIERLTRKEERAIRRGPEVLSESKKRSEPDGVNEPSIQSGPHEGSESVMVERAIECERVRE